MYDDLYLQESHHSTTAIAFQKLESFSRGKKKFKSINLWDIIYHTQFFVLGPYTQTHLAFVVYMSSRVTACVVSPPPAHSNTFVIATHFVQWSLWSLFAVDIKRIIGLAYEKNMCNTREGFMSREICLLIVNMFFFLNNLYN